MWRPAALTTNIDTRITGTKFEYIFHEYIKNSAHFPLAIILLVLLLPLQSGSTGFSHIVILLLGSILQAIYIGSKEYEKTPRPLVGNLIGVVFCLAFLAFHSGKHVFEAEPYAAIFLVYSLCIGSFQQLRSMITMEQGKHFLILAEHFMRIFLLTAPFWTSHVMEEHRLTSIQDLINEPYYVYLGIVIGVYGLFIGLTSINEYRYLNILRNTAAELRKYSEWFLGPELFYQTVINPHVLDLKNVVRWVLFFDIRGFTQWSSDKSPAEAVDLVNQFFLATEKELASFHVLKMELTGDEVMVVFEDSASALRSAIQLRKVIGALLEEKGLSAGFGLNNGLLIEGLVGGKNIKKFSVFGDTVNTGKRICDAAAGNEILLSQSAYLSTVNHIETGRPRLVRVKGKSEGLLLYPLLEYREKPSLSRSKVRRMLRKAQGISQASAKRPQPAKKTGADSPPAEEPLPEAGD